jgi:hypothetical protein
VARWSASALLACLLGWNLLASPAVATADPVRVRITELTVSPSTWVPTEDGPLRVDLQFEAKRTELNRGGPWTPHLRADAEIFGPASLKSIRTLDTEVDLTTLAPGDAFVAFVVHLTWDGATRAGTAAYDGPHIVRVTVKLTREHTGTGHVEIRGTASSSATFVMASARPSDEVAALQAAAVALADAAGGKDALGPTERAEYVKLVTVAAAGGAAGYAAKVSGEIMDADLASAEFGKPLTTAQIDAWKALAAAQPGLFSLDWNRFLGTPRILRYGPKEPSAGTTVDVALEALAPVAMLADLGPLDELVFDSESAHEGRAIVTFSRYSNGVPVLGDSASVVVQTTDLGLTPVVAGASLTREVTDASLAIDDVIPEDQALAIARSVIDPVSGVTSTAFLFVSGGGPEDPLGGPALGYFVTFETAAGEEPHLADNQVVLLDALTGEVIQVRDFAQFDGRLLADATTPYADPAGGADTYFDALVGVPFVDIVDGNFDLLGRTNANGEWTAPPATGQVFADFSNTPWPVKGGR